MKLSREQLKDLIKECLVEVLSEGLGRNLTESVKPRPRGISESRTAVQHHTNRRTFDPRLDTPMVPGRRSPSSALRDAVIRESGGNDVMASILMDTAKNTLPAMLAGGDNDSRGPSMVEQINGTPEEVFGEDTTSKWAALAFNEPISKKTA